MRRYLSSSVPLTILCAALVSFSACTDETTGGDTVGEPDGLDDVAEDDSRNPGFVDDEATLVQIVSPTPDTVVQGAVKVRLEPIGTTERDVDFVELLVGDQLIFEDTKLPTEFVLDTRDYPGSELEFVARAQDGFDEGGHRINFRTNNPPIRFTEVTPRTTYVRNGDVLSVEIHLDGPDDIQLTADLSALDSGYRPGAEAAYPLGANSYALTYVLSADNSRRDGVYTIPFKAKVGGWEVNYTEFQIELRNEGVSPIFVPGGIYVDEMMPLATSQDAGIAPSVGVSNTVILTGGSTNLDVDLSSYPAQQDLVGVIVGIDGVSGFYQVPIAEDGLDALEVPLRLRHFESYETLPSHLKVRVALRDRRGQVTPYTAKDLEITEVGGGDIQVSVSWDTKTDVDLHVVDPFGCELYYGRRSDSGYSSSSQCLGAGGELDLDSNAGCGGTDKRNENIFWPPGRAPEGEYTVRLNYWSACNITTPTNYIVTVNYCGRAEVYEGTFLPANATGGGEGSGQVITTFDNRMCTRRARGRIRYQDRVFSQNGFGAYQWQHLPGVSVELREIGSNAVIGTGVTDRNGDYEIAFPSNSPGFVVAVLAKSDPEERLRDIKVYDHPKFNRIYEVTSPPIILEGDDQVIRQNVDISVAQDSGAFNIFDVLRQGYDLVRLANGRELGELRAYWKTGTDTTDTIYCSQYLYESGVCSELQSVSVQGKETDRDEFDDMIILREFFKFVLDTVSRDSHPGGEGDGRRTDARRAWTEGISTFFAADTLSSRNFVNSRPHAVYIVDDLERMPTPYGKSVHGNQLSHYLVSAFLWDIRDSRNEDWDDIDRMREGIYDAVFSYFPSENFNDRGPVGVDMTDFLDGWFCRGWGEKEAMKQLLEYYGYPYDFAGPADCSR